ncbi:VOC family protein [Tunturiibacter gelidoferens]|uniref:Catechol 2,3-dioxygenase-like lactoylglutathione lyase family enzyme n=1 Tax=Tunturiibacter gelidiferens TaxID=3069689 RepID=A0ACC5P2N8_9BACT|nr:VOC family protein [Edaphobacter lichenicola]MBB5340976.1 catechol 2,3-dioxygenase-like lactoylglutathione lyase family enzyme [Edaphobacter lichenicola]
MRRVRPRLPLSLALCLLLSLSGLSLAQERPAITGIAFIRMYTADPAASAIFYGKTLGLGHAESDGITRYSVNDLQWLEVEALPTPAPASRLAAIGFTTHDAPALERFLKAHNVVIEQPLAHGIFAVHDPEGNLVYFVQEGTKIPGLPITSPNATSHRIIHTGFLVKDAATEDRFYKDLLGFRPYWHGGMQEGKTDWVSQQVPDGTDWLEYMLYDIATPSAKQLGVLNHFSLGTNQMSDVVASLARNKCEGPNCAKTQMGKDGKVQLNLFDPDLTRVEYMEFKPSGTPCCSPILGKAPTEAENR